MSTPANASGGMVERSITGEDLIAELDRLAVGRGALPTVLWPVAVWSYVRHVHLVWPPPRPRQAW